MSRPRIAGFGLGVYIFKDAAVARVMEYHHAYGLYRGDFEQATEAARVSA